MSSVACQYGIATLTYGTYRPFINLPCRTLITTSKCVWGVPHVTTCHLPSIRPLSTRSGSKLPIERHEVPRQLAVQGTNNWLAVLSFTRFDPMTGGSGEGEALHPKEDLDPKRIIFAMFGHHNPIIKETSHWVRNQPDTTKIVRCDSGGSGQYCGHVG